MSTLIAQNFSAYSANASLPGLTLTTGGTWVLSANNGNYFAEVPVITATGGRLRNPTTLTKNGWGIVYANGANPVSKFLRYTFTLYVADLTGAAGIMVQCNNLSNQPGYGVWLSCLNPADIHWAFTNNGSDLYRGPTIDDPQSLVGQTLTVTACFTSNCYVTIESSGSVIGGFTLGDAWEFANAIIPGSNPTSYFLGIVLYGAMTDTTGIHLVSIDGEVSAPTSIILTGFLSTLKGHNAGCGCLEFRPLGTGLSSDCTVTISDSFAGGIITQGGFSGTSTARNPIIKTEYGSTVFRYSGSGSATIGSSVNLSFINNRSLSNPATLALPIAANILIMSGDSTMFGTPYTAQDSDGYVLNQNFSTPGLMSQAFTDPTWAIANIGVGGTQLNNLMNAIAGQISPYYQSAGQNMLVMQIGINDFLNIGISYTGPSGSGCVAYCIDVLFPNLKTLYANVYAISNQSWRITGCTLPGNSIGDVNAGCGQLQTMLKAHWSGLINAFADIFADFRIGGTNYVFNNYYDFDGTHLMTPGYNACMQNILGAVRMGLNNSATQPVPSAIPVLQSNSYQYID